MNQQSGLSQLQKKGDDIPEFSDAQLSYSKSVDHQNLPADEIDFYGSDDEEQHKGKNDLIEKDLPLIQEEGSGSNIMMLMEEEAPKQKSLFGIVLVKEIKNPHNQPLSRKDTMTAFNTLFKMVQKNAKSSAQLVMTYQLKTKFQPVLNIKEVVIEPILSTGILKGTVLIDLNDEMYSLVMKNPYCSQLLLDKMKGIEREFTFNFYDLDKLKEKHKVLQTGRFQNEFIQVVTDKTVTGRKTTQILLAMHIRDNQIYAIKKFQVQLKQLPNWSSIYANQSHEIREIKAMLRLSHRNILRLFSWWIEEEEEMTKTNKLRKMPYLYLQTEYLSYKDQSSDLLEFIHVNFEYYNVNYYVIQQCSRCPFHQEGKKCKIYSTKFWMESNTYMNKVFSIGTQNQRIFLQLKTVGGLIIHFFKQLQRIISQDMRFRFRQECYPRRRKIKFVFNCSEQNLRNSRLYKWIVIFFNQHKVKPMTSKKRFICQEMSYLTCANSSQQQIIELPFIKMLHKSSLSQINSSISKFPDQVIHTYPEEIQLFRAMNLEKKYKSVKQLRESNEWQAFMKK